MRTFLLPPRHEELFNKAFPNQSWQYPKQLTGFSGASVYQVTYNNNPVIVKIAHPAVIKREFDSYREYVVDALRGRVPTLSETCESDDGQEALLRYTYAGTAGSRTLFEFLEEQEDRAIVRVRSILRKMFAKEQPERPRTWWVSNAPTNILCREHYDRWMPVYLELQCLPGAVDGAILLDADHIYQDYVTRLSPGQIVKLQGFQLEKEKDFTATLYLGHPQSPSFRVRVTGIAADAKENSEPIYASIIETRKTLFTKYAEAAVTKFSMNYEHFLFDGYTYVNPLYYLDQLLGTHYDAVISTIHGDLNLRNILIEETSATHEHWPIRQLNRLLNLKSYDWWLIDFASTQTGPILLDLQWLEVQVINWLLIPALQRAGHGPHALRILLTALHHRRSLPMRLRSQEVATPYALLREIRDLAESYLAGSKKNPSRWEEYYRGLTLGLLGTLKQDALSEAVGEQVKTYALIGAATTVRWSGTGTVEKPMVDWPKRIRFAGIGLSSVVSIILLGVVGWNLIATQSNLIEPCNDDLPEIRIGIAVNRGAPYGIFGKDQIIGAAIARDYYNQNGGVAGHCINLLFEDLESITRSDREATTKLENNFKKLVDQRVVAIIGPGLSEQVELIQMLLARIKTTVIGPSTTKLGIICDNPFFMRVSAPGAWYAYDTLDVVHGKVGKVSPRVTIAYAEDDAFTAGEHNLFKTYIEDHPIAYTLAGEIPYKINDPEIEIDEELPEKALEILATKPDFVIVAGLTADGRSLIHELRSRNYAGPIIGGNGLNTPYLFDNCGEGCNDFDNFYMPIAYHHTSESTSIREIFLQEYQSYDETEEKKPLYGSHPGQFAAQMFSGVQIVVEALKTLDEIQPEEFTEQTRLESLRYNLNEVLHNSDFVTPLGDIRFTPEGELIQNEFYVAVAERAKGAGYTLVKERTFPNLNVEEQAAQECTDS